MTKDRRNMPPLPDRMKVLPIDDRGYRVPWFVAFIDGKPDFRVIRRGGIAEAYNKQKCWLCGGKRGVIGAFVIGPMCAVNRVSAEPPSHRECAEYAVRACPFLVRPMAKRRDADMEKLGAVHPAGVMIERNPGVTLLWTSKNWRPFRAGNGFLFNVGDPLETHWYAEGRQATRAEVMASIDSGYPLLKAEADKDKHPGEANAALAAMLDAAINLVPAA